MTSDYVIVTIKLCPEVGIDEYIIVCYKEGGLRALPPPPPPPPPTPERRKQKKPDLNKVKKKKKYYWTSKMEWK